MEFLINKVTNMDKNQVINLLENSGIKYVRTSISNECCAINIAIQDVKSIDQEYFEGFWFSECAQGLDYSDY